MVAGAYACVASAEDDAEFAGFAVAVAAAGVGDGPAAAELVFAGPAVGVAIGRSYRGLFAEYLRGQLAIPANY